MTAAIKPPGKAAAARMALRFSDWPAADQAAWRLACQPPAFLKAGGGGSKWRPSARASVLANFERWLGDLRVHGWLLLEEAPAERATPERVGAFIIFLQQDRASITVAGYIANLIMAVNALFPEKDWRWLRNGRANLQNAATPVRNKAADMEASWDLVDLGYALMAEAEALGDLCNQSAILYRDGFMIALLAERPFRRRNFLSIELARHLTRSGSSWHMSFPGTETKNKRAIDRLFPASLIPSLERYLAFYRPHLLSAVEREASVERDQAPFRLWISCQGNPLSITGFAKAIRRHAFRRFGHAMNPHIFRHCAVTSLADGDPENVRMGPGLLGHNGFTSVERDYLVAKHDAADQHFQGLIAARRRAMRGKKGSK